MFRKVLVLGGRGFIGKRTVDLLVAKGYSVRVASRAASESPSTAQVEYVKAQVGEAASIRDAASGTDGIIHLANSAGESWADFERDFIQGSKNVAEAGLGANVKRVVYASSIASLYLGGSHAVAESAGNDPQPEGRALYARAKVRAEQVFRDYYRDRRLPVVIERPGVVVGRGGLLNHSGVGYWPNDLICMGWGHGTTPIPFVLVDDVANGVIAALETPDIEGREFNLAGDVFLSAREYVSLLAKYSRRRFQFLPQSPLKLQLIEIAKWALKMIAGKPENPFPSFRDLKSRALTAPLDCTAAKTALNWRPNADLDVFVREVIESGLIPVKPGDLRREAIAPGLA